MNGIENGKLRIENSLFRTGMLATLLCLLVLAPSVARAQFDPVAWYSFDGLPLGRDVSGNGHHFISTLGMAYQGTAPQLVDSFLQVDALQWPPGAPPCDPPGTFTELTVEFWFRRDKEFYGGTMVEMYGKCLFEVNQQWIRWTVKCQPTVQYDLVLPFYGAGVTDAHNVLDGNWHHFAGTFDVKTGTQRLYVDGRNETGMTRHHGTTAAMNPSSAFVPYGSLSTAIGDLDEIAIYDTVLPPTWSGSILWAACRARPTPPTSIRSARSRPRRKTWRRGASTR